jgi:hypothetical protein
MTLRIENSARLASGHSCCYFYFILQLLYDVMDIPFAGAGFCDGE